MGMVTDIERLGEDIISSYDRRVKSLKELSDEMHKMLDGFQKERMTDFNALMKEIQETQDKRNKEVHHLLQEFKAKMKEVADEIARMSAEWHKISETMHRRRGGKGAKSNGGSAKELKAFEDVGRSRGKEKRQS